MKSATSKDRAGREAVYPVPVLMVPCPRCGAPVGEKCTETWQARAITRATPHKPRIDESKPKDKR